MAGGSKDYFDGIGSQWETLRRGFFSEAVREQALDAAAVAAGGRAADLGAGCGFMTRGLLARGLRVIAVDQSSVMLAALREALGDDQRITCRVGLAEDLPLQDGEVDASFANMFLHHVDSPPAAISEMARIVRPGGIVVVTDLDAHEHDFLRREHHDRWLGFERQDVVNWFRAAGLSGVRVDDMGQQCCASSCDGEVASVSIFLACGTVPLEA